MEVVELLQDKERDHVIVACSDTWKQGEFRVPWNIFVIKCSIMIYKAVHIALGNFICDPTWKGICANVANMQWRASEDSKLCFVFPIVFTKPPQVLLTSTPVSIPSSRPPDITYYLTIIKLHSEGTRWKICTDVSTKKVLAWFPASTSNIMWEWRSNHEK